MPLTDPDISVPRRQEDFPLTGEEEEDDEDRDDEDGDDEDEGDEESPRCMQRDEPDPVDHKAL